MWRARLERVQSQLQTLGRAPRGLLLTGGFVDGRPADVRVVGRRIAAVGSSLAGGPHDQEIPLDGAALVPGLVNAHDHLYLDVLPTSGRGPYPSARAWSREFPSVYRPRMAHLLTLPEADRARWGALRNLLSGVTWVAHHDHLTAGMLRRDFPVRIVWPYRCFDSLGMVDDARLAARGRGPLFVHAAEGTDADSSSEVGQLESLGLLNDQTLVVHAVGLGPGDAIRIERSGAAVVTCPTSNRFLLGAVPDHRALTRVLVGTDSTLTGSAHLLDELRELGRAGWTAERAFAAATHLAARCLRLPIDAGRIVPGAPAHLVAFEGVGRWHEVVHAAAPRHLLLAVVDGEVRAARADRWPKLRTQLPGRVLADGAEMAVGQLDARLVRATRARFPDAAPVWLQSA